MFTKKISKLSALLAFLITVCVLIIGYFCVRDFFLTDAQKMGYALTAIQDKKPYKAEKYLLSLTKSEHPKMAERAAYYLANLYLKGENGFSKNPQKAEKYLMLSADKGSVRAAYELALLYDIGSQIPEHRDKALEYMTMAAKQNYAPALYAMGVWAERGYMDVPFGKIVQVYEMAANQGYQNAMASLISIYSNGYGPFPYNIQRANYWLHQLQKSKKEQQ